MRVTEKMIFESSIAQTARRARTWTSLKTRSRVARGSSILATIRWRPRSLWGTRWIRLASRPSDKMHSGQPTS